MIEIIEGDLLYAKTQYIAHQCNLVSKNASGLAKSIFDKYPNSNTYSSRNSDLNQLYRLNLGTIQIFERYQLDLENAFYIINMYAQFYPGKPNEREQGFTITDHDDGEQGTNILLFVYMKLQK